MNPLWSALLAAAEVDPEVASDVLAVTAVVVLVVAGWLWRRKTARRPR